VHLIPCTEDLASVVRDHATDGGFEFRLRELIARHARDYDFVLIDTPPGLGELSTMALLAARWVIVPARPADFDVGGAVKIADLIDGAIAEYNPHVRVLGVLIGQTARRWNLGRDARDALQEAGLPEFGERIPFMVRVGAAPRYAAPTIVLEPDSRVGCAYRRVAATIADAVARPDLCVVSA
jgi:chromosome partitioning protein